MEAKRRLSRRRKEGRVFRKLNGKGCVFLTLQCPYAGQSVGAVRQYGGEQGVPLTLVPADTPEQARNLPCVFSNRAVFYQGTFRMGSLLLDTENLKRI